MLRLGVDPPQLDGLSSSASEELAAVLSDPAQATTAAELLPIFDVVDGKLDRACIEQVLDVAQKLDLHDSWLDDLAKRLDPDLGAIIADKGDRNLRSITDGRVNLAGIDDVSHWLMPYNGDDADDHLGDRYRELDVAGGSLGYEFWSSYDRHGFAFRVSQQRRPLLSPRIGLDLASTGRAS